MMSLRSSQERRGYGLVGAGARRNQRRTPPLASPRAPAGPTRLGAARPRKRCIRSRERHENRVETRCVRLSASDGRRKPGSATPSTSFVGARSNAAPQQRRRLAGLSPFLTLAPSGAGVCPRGRNPETTAPGSKYGDGGRQREDPEANLGFLPLLSPRAHFHLSQGAATNSQPSPSLHASSEFWSSPLAMTEAGTGNGGAG